MKHPSSATLYAHWNAMRVGQDCPERGEISPAALRQALSDTFILAYDTALGHPFRLAGTRMCMLFGRELRGHAFISLWPEGERRKLARLVARLADESVGLVAAADGVNTQGDGIGLELLLLPLRHNGRTHQRLIGTLAPAASPYWIGARPLTALSLGSERYIEPRRETPVPILRIPPARLRQGLRIIDGGQC